MEEKPNRNDLPAYIKEIDGVDISEYRPILKDKLEEVEMVKADVHKILLRSMLKLSYNREVKDILDGWGPDVLSATNNYIHVKGLGLINEGKYADGLKMLEFSCGHVIPKADNKASGGVQNLVNVNIASESFMSKVEELNGMMGKPIEVEVK